MPQKGPLPVHHTDVPIHLAGNPLDRADTLRADPERLQAMFDKPDTAVLWFANGKPALDLRSDEPALLLRPSTDSLSREAEDAVFLGMEGARAVFAVDVSAHVQKTEPVDGPALFDDGMIQVPAQDEGVMFADLRKVYPLMAQDTAAIAGTALGLLNWHRSHRFCAKCGAPSRMTQGGWHRTCTKCGRHHFPRTDPVVIMLVTHGNKVLLGRSHGWPDGMYSLLAGFMEPGETLEEAVRREVWEETGIKTGAVSYVASQPWPFPNSLMIGCRTEALDTKITLDEKEMEDAIWVSREDYLEICAGNASQMRPARRGAIAHTLLNLWLKNSI